MRLLQLLLFLAYPLLEIAVMIKTGGAIGFWPLVGIVVVTMGIGALALRRHGLTMLQRMAEEMAAGRPPVAAMMDGALTALAGVLLMAPGLITDTLGLMLLVPLLRRWVAARLLGRVLFGGSIFETQSQSDSGAAPNEAAHDERFPGEDAFGRKRTGQRTTRTPIVIEGEYERIEERTIKPEQNGKPPRSPAND